MPALKDRDIHYMIYISKYDIMEPKMLVSKWGNSLAVRLPKALVDELGLAPGDELKVVEASKRRIAVEKADKRAEFRSRWSNSTGRFRGLQVRP